MAQNPSLLFAQVLLALVSLLALIWDLSNTPQHDPALMMGPFGSELTFVLNGGAFLWFAAADLRVLHNGQLSDRERTTKHVVRLTMGIYALVVGVILVNVAPHVFPGLEHPGASLFSLAAPAVLFVPANTLLLRQITPQVQKNG